MSPRLESIPGSVSRGLQEHALPGAPQDGGFDRRRHPRRHRHRRRWRHRGWQWPLETFAVARERGSRERRNAYASAVYYHFIRGFSPRARDAPRYNPPPLRSPPPPPRPAHSHAPFPPTPFPRRGAPPGRNPPFLDP